MAEASYVSDLAAISSFVRSKVLSLFSHWTWPAADIHLPLQGQSNWPKNIPDELPATLKDCIGIDDGHNACPVLLLSGRDVQAWKRAFLERKALLRAQAINKKRIQECTTRIEEAYCKARHFEQMHADLARVIEAGPPDNCSDPEAALGKTNKQIEDLRTAFDEVERLRQDLANERTMLAFSMLEQHMHAWRAQVDADDTLMRRLQQQVLLKEDAMDFFYSWKKLPLDYRRSGGLHDEIQYIREEESETAATTDAFHELARDEASLFSAEINMEIAKGYALYARDALERHNAQAKIREVKHEKSKIAGHLILTQSQFATEGLRKKEPYVYQAVVADQAVREAGERLHRWQQLGVYDPADLQALGRVQDIDEDVEVGERRATRNNLADLRRMDIRSWIPNHESRHLLNCESDSSLDDTTETSGEYVDIDDSLTMKERRIYESLRAQEWSSLRASEYEGFRLEKSRMFAASTKPLTEVPDQEASVASSL